MISRRALKNGTNVMAAGIHTKITQKQAFYHGKDRDFSRGPTLKKRTETWLTCIKHKEEQDVNYWILLLILFFMFTTFSIKSLAMLDERYILIIIVNLH